MKLTSLRPVAALLPVILIACGGDDDAAGKNTGVFVDSAVTGLRYTAGKSSGTTNAAGEFKYDDGQTVTFAVGGIVIGSVVGAARVTPFDLYGVTPPTTEAAFAADLTQPEKVTPFERVLNVALFLQAMDADHNPDNGIDVTAAGAALADASLDFGQEPQVFADQHLLPLIVERGVGERRTFGSSAAAHLFASVGVTVAAAAVTSVVTDNNDDGTNDRVLSTQYDALGRPVLSTRDPDGDGVIDTQVATVYDATTGLFVSRTTSSDFSGGTFHGTTVATSTVDTTTGYVASDTEEAFVDSVITDRTVTNYTINAFGSSTVEDTKFDSGANGSFESSRNVTIEYDAHNRITKRTVSSYADVGITLIQQDVLTSIYDGNGDEVTRTEETDTEGDGVFDERVSTTTIFDASHHETSIIVLREAPAGALARRQTTTTTYLSNGSPQTTIETDDINGDLVDEIVITTTRLFDADGKVTSEIKDSVNGGLIHTTSRVTYTYTTSGKVLERKAIENQNSQADQDDDYIYVDTYTYDESGNELTHLMTSDFGADSTIESKTRTTQTYTTIANGVRLLAGRYAY